MRLKKEFVIHNTGEEQVMVATGSMTAHFQGLVRSNKTAAFIVEQLQSETTEEQIVDKMLERYDAPRNVVLADVAGIIEKLRSIGAIED